MKRDPLLFLEDISEAILLIEKYIQKISKEDFAKDVQLQDSVIRRLEIIGEAAKNIPAHLKEKYPIIPGKEICGMRDVLTHAYFGTNIDRVWKTVSQDLQKLKTEIEKPIKQEKH